ncbi:hypothetical protein V7S43_004182 [Phytophthora oleae]|uniref:Uncharacterized protein n=1 Tax=Phytophthora oleae TaxID=2107226 RepID=A0ABD3FVQ0_9STRA
MQHELNNVQLGSNSTDDSSDEPMKERNEHTTAPVLVVAIDEARALLTIKNSNGDNAFRILRRALRMVNTTAPVLNANGLVFGILVDTNSRVHEFVLALSQDPSSRLSATKNMALFPPFILTETMDIMLGVKSTSRPITMSDDNTIMKSESDSDDDSMMKSESDSDDDSDVDTVDQESSRSRVLTTDKEDV